MADFKIKAKLKKGVVSVKAMAKHEMTTYDIAKKQTGDRENANFIFHITATVNGETVWEVSTSQFLSKNPIFKYKFQGIGKKGDHIIMTATDRKGHALKGKGKIK